MTAQSFLLPSMPVATTDMRLKPHTGCLQGVDKCGRSGLQASRSCPVACSYLIKHQQLVLGTLTLGPCPDPPEALSPSIKGVDVQQHSTRLAVDSPAPIPSINNNQRDSQHEDFRPGCS